MLPLLGMLGGGGGGGMPSTSTSSTATATATGSVGDVGQSGTAGGGGGGRGFTNNVAFPGATLTASQPINGAAMNVGGIGTVALVVAAVAIGGFLLWRLAKR
jgi:hypothetical protein